MPDDQPIPVGPPLKVNVSDVADQEIDAKAWAKLSGEGTKDSGLPERTAAAFIMALARLIVPAVRVAASSAEAIRRRSRVMRYMNQSVMMGQKNTRKRRARPTTKPKLPPMSSGTMHLGAGTLRSG